jgi:hypothetical protein
MAKVAVDVDGVLCDFTAGIVKVVNGIWPGKLPEGFEPNNWNYAGVLDKQEFKGVWQHIQGTPNWWFYLRPYYDSMRHLGKFLASVDGHDLYFCTARVDTVGATVAMQTSKWFEECGIEGQGNYLATMQVVGASKKRQVYAGLGIEWSVDDYPETVAECDSLDGHRAYLLDRPWNQDAKGLRRIYNLGEFFDEIRAKAK